MVGANLEEAVHFSFGPNTAHRIVRIAEHDSLHVVFFDGGGHAFKVDVVAIIAIAE